MQGVAFDGLDHAGKVDLVLFRDHLARALARLDEAAAEAERLQAIVPYGEAIVALDAARGAMEPVETMEAGAALDRIATAIASSIADGPEAGEDILVVAWIGELREAVERWAAFYAGYDPAIAWWTREPLARILTGLQKAGQLGPGAKTVPGRPVGRAALLKDLAYERIPYSPERLIEIGEREYAWCLDEMKRAAAELGFGDDWLAAVESVKRTYLPPGEQPAMVRGLALEAIERVRDLVTIPELAEETWRMEMMSPESQKTNPFFLGGETIVVSYPTDAMTHAEKLMSMRGNNPNFSRATVQHELIPGHHLQMYMTARYRPYRSVFSTPFWIEGWTLYWEMLLWELGFPRTPEERIGMLFWRMHRAVRVSFSLRFHLGRMTTAECVEALVSRVGHERLNAEGEVRRSFNGQYPPLYQAAYLLGGLQFRAISRELRAEGWSYRRIHDAMLRENEMPPTMMRAAIRRDPLPEEGPEPWLFDGPESPSASTIV